MAKARRKVEISSADAQLRAESPAYSSDDGWESIGPQGMSVVMSVRLNPASAMHLAALARQERRTPSGLIREWVLERLRQEDAAPVRRAIGESRGPYGPEPDTFERLRAEYRPSAISFLMVGESRPAAGTFFYLANSRLFFATREAFTRAMGEAASGDAFLRQLRDSGIWLYDLAQSPVNRLPGRPRRHEVEKRTSELVTLLRTAQPRTVVVVKRSLEPMVRTAMSSADLAPERLVVLPFPLYQWREAYVDGLARALQRHFPRSGQ